MIKFAVEIVEDIKKRGNIEVPEGYVTGESFEKWLYERREYVNSDKCRARS